MKEKIIKRLPIYIIILFLLCLIGFAAILFQANQVFNSPNNRKPVLYLKMQDDDECKPPYYRVLRKNREISKTKKFKISKEEIVDASALFRSHLKDDEIYLTLNHQPLRNQYHQRVKDPVYHRMMMQVVKEQKYDIGYFFMFKVRGRYYAYLALNAGLDDTGTIYRYSFKKKRMLNIGETENDQKVIAVMNPK